MGSRGVDGAGSIGERGGVGPDPRWRRRRQKRLRGGESEAGGAGPRVSVASSGRAEGACRAPPPFFPLEEASAVAQAVLPPLRLPRLSALGAPEFIPRHILRLG